MTKNINLIELFSGIGGFAKGLIDAGYTIDNHYFSEIDKHAIANYKYNFKNSIYVGSVTDFYPTGITGTNIITFGSPCQDLSLAGKRQGLNGKRSVLILEAIRIIQQTKPSVFIWENVKGAFSSNNSKDFWAIIQAFANIGGYRLEWQLLNSSWFLPQNRERLYLVGHLDGSSFPSVFPFSENDTIFNKSFAINKGQSQTQNCTTITNKFGNRADDTFIEVPRIAGCLTGGGHSGGLHSDMTVIKTNNKKGFDLLTENDSLNYGNQKSQTRRGRVGKGISQTLDTQCTIGIKQLNVNKEFGNQPRQQNRVYDTNGIMACLSSSRTDDKAKISVVCENESSIRRLTEIECERLQGFPDNWTQFGDYDGVIKPIAKTQRYKLLGNAVTVSVVKEIAQRLNINP